MAPVRNTRWVRWGAAYLLLCQIQALTIVDRVVYGEWAGKSGDKITQTINLLQIAISIALFYRGYRYWPTLRKGGLLAIGLAVLMLCSAAWSVDSGATFRQGIQYLFMIVGAIGIAENLEGDEFMDLLARICLLSAIVTLVLMVVSPANVYGEAGDFRGVFSQKNTLGQAMAMGALAYLHRIWLGKGSRFFTLAMLGVLIFLTLKSESATSLLVIFLFAALGLAIQLMQKRAARMFVIFGLALLAPIALLAAFNGDAVLEMLGKDPTLTGRTDIWDFVIPDIYKRPLLGWGYSAFWSMGNPAALEISDALRWHVPQAHNGLLELLLSAGLLGAVLFFYFGGRTVWMAVKCLRTSERAMGISCFSIGIGILLVGVSETVLIYPSAIAFVFFVTGFFCERAVAEGRLRQRAALRRLFKVAAFDRPHAAPRRNPAEVV